MCSKTISLFYTEEYVKYTIWSITFLSFPILIYGIFCILYKTPSKIGQSVKWNLLNLHVTTVVYELFFNVFITPYIFPPSTGGFGLGLFTYFGVSFIVQIYLLIFVGGAMCSSWLFIAENLYHTLAVSKFKLNKKPIRVLFYLFNYSMILVAILPTISRIQSNYVEIPNITCPYYLLFDNRTTFISSDPFGMGIGLIVEAVSIAVQTVFFIFATVYHMFIKKKIVRTSIRTQKIQKRFFYALCLQLSIPFLFMALPLVYIMFSLITGYYNQLLTNHMVVLLATYSLISTIVLLIVQKPYRDFTFRRKKVYSKNTVL